MALALKKSPAAPTRDSVLVAAEGAIDLAHASVLDGFFDELRRDGKRHLVLDLAGVRYVSSSGFGVLVKHAQALSDSGGSVSLLGISTKVRVVAEMLGLERVFGCVCEQRPDAA